ncbi:MAG: Rhamnulokinase [Firmicutes bacterium ADurb.Bin193]|nr:MAG: Rhamnulokinase [Firmicutes bacterium ADurb.Bin193]
MGVTNVLAFDFGASSGRSILGSFDGDTIKLSETHRFSNDPVFVNGHLYWDILRLLFEIKAGILKTANSGLGEISGIGIDTWGVDFGLIDKNGELLGNPYHYRDSRTDGMIAKANELAGELDIYCETGIQTLWFNTLYQLLAAKENSPHLLGEAKTLLFMPDLMNYFLTGVKTTEYSIASTSQLLNIETRDWSDKIFKKFGFDETLFTDIVMPGTVIGKIKEDIAQEAGIPSVPVIAVTSHDTASAVASVPFDNLENSVYISCGTWSLMGMELSQPLVNDMTREYNFTNEGGAENTIRFLKNIMGLWIVQECRRFWQRTDSGLTFATLENLASEAEGFVSFIDCDYEDFGSPGNMPEKVKDYCRRTNQPVPESMGEIVRCVAQSIALKYRYTIECIEDITGKKIETINMVGGGIKDRMLCQFTANATGRPVKAGPVEATAAGNIILQLIALGKIESLAKGREIVKNSFSTEDYLPKDSKLWNEAYERFLKILSLQKGGEK